MIALDALRGKAPSALPEYCASLRANIIALCAAQGGHLASSLGAVELIVALHYVLDTPQTPVCFDVGHQTYAHKLLTGREAAMQQLRASGGAAPFPLRSESIYDAFAGGHAGNALSAAAGFAAGGQAAVAVLGDGGLTCGVSFEALNHIGAQQWRVLAIINDNGYAIDENVGALKRYGRIEDYAHALGWDYVGIDDGHDVVALVARLRGLFPITRPILWHLRTQKGKGLPAAEADPIAWHGRPAAQQPAGNIRSAAVVVQWLKQHMARDDRIHVITPAMLLGSGLRGLAERYPHRVHDVGIAEQHALSFAAGLAAAGQKPILTIYATFLQRGFDQLVHDIALQNLPVTLLIDRAGVVGGDGDTHIGAYDMLMAKALPNVCVAAPADGRELCAMLDCAYAEARPMVLRYPRDLPQVSCDCTCTHAPMVYGRGVVCRRGTDWLMIAIGELLAPLHRLAAEVDATLLNLRFIKPFDQGLLAELLPDHQQVLIVESGAQIGGVGHDLAAWIAAHSEAKVVLRGLPDAPIGHGSVSEQYQRAGLDIDHLRWLIT